jgi:predicted enzyme related to lactoylglutathione lyase
MGAVGIGGVFFRAKDPGALQAWYKQHLGVSSGPEDGYVWMQQGGPTVFSPFKADTDYFPADRQYMLNFRVPELDKLIAKLRTDGVEVTTNAEWDSPETGKFARVHDPEGNPVELWQPPED